MTPCPLCLRLAAPVIRLRQPEGAIPTPAGDKKPMLIVKIFASFRPIFEKPYFNAAMAGFVLSSMSLVVVATLQEILGTPSVDYEWIPYFTNTIAAPVICLFVLGLAYKRGELQKVWGYGERWMDVPEDKPQVLVDIEANESTPGLEFCEKEKVPEVDEKEQIL